MQPAYAHVLPNSPLHSHFATLILSLKAPSSQFSLNSTLPFLFSSYSSCSSYISYSNQSHFPPPFSQALQGPSSLVFEEHNQTHTQLHFQAPREETIPHPFNSPTTSKASCGADSNSFFFLYFKHQNSQASHSQVVLGLVLQVS